MNGDFARTREIYERAISNVPPTPEKRFWRRYIYLWINYALFEELEAKDPEKTREVYKACLKMIDHKKFSFSKIWIMYAQFEIRQLRLDNARSILGHALGVAEHQKIYKTYIELEQLLGNIDRCRILYKKYLEMMPENCQGWCKFADLERSLEEFDRCRAIFELATEQPVLDMPEIVWKSYIDFEISQTEYDKTRSLYRRLLDRTKHVKVWISFAQFENSLQNTEGARALYQEAYKALKPSETKEERVMLVESWKEFENNLGNNDIQKAEVAKLMPHTIKKKRPLKADDGSDSGWEEYYDYIFPDEKESQPNLKILQMAHLWKRKKIEEDSKIETNQNENE